MTTDMRKPIIAFLWRPREITSSVVDMSRRTGTRALFDVSAVNWDSAGRALLHADASADSVELKISGHQLMDPGLEDFLKETAIETIWVQLHTVLPDEPTDVLLSRIQDLSNRITVIPIVGEASLIFRILDSCPEIRNIALKGNEASGFVGTETIFTLYGSARARVRDRADAAGFFIWGGVSTPEAAAAFLSAGARGIVFESLHWLTDLTAIDDTIRGRIAKLRPDHTDLVGSNIGVPCRFFNKGNSIAVKELKSFAGSLCGAEIRDEQRRFFAQRIQKEAIEALDSQFDRNRLVPLGVEAAFADAFIRRFGTGSEEAFLGFVSAVEKCCAGSAARTNTFVNSPVAAEIGIRYPFIQGAMSWITDVPEFALKVAQSGALPTVALGLMPKAVLDQRLGRLQETMGDLPYAVNLITLQENPYRDEQLAWIRDLKPRFAVIAAGEPAHGQELLAHGIEVIYIAPTEDLLKLAFNAGIRYVICEGHEAGGHVGQHSTLTLAQMIIDLRHREPSLFEGRTVILAGGVFNRETAFMAAMLGADAVQMGTSYLVTSEIVATGALTSLYQRKILESLPGDTVVTGEATGLRVRSLQSPKIDAICTLERDFAAGGQDDASFRREIETMSAGSLFIAARGLERPGGPSLDQDRCLKEGQFMTGACAGALDHIRTVAELHEDVAEGALAEGLPFTGPIREVSAGRPTAAELKKVAGMKGRTPASVYRSPDLERIAITGMAVVNALGKTPEEVLAASFAAKCGIVPVPSSRWDHGIYYDPRPRVQEKTYCKVGAFMDLTISRKDLGIPPQDFRTMTSATKITMWLAKKAVEESKILESDIPRERIAVLISQNSGEAAATLQDLILRGSVNDVVAAVKRVVALTPEMESAVAEEVKGGRIAVDDTTLLGRLNCTAGGFICNKYGFQGPSFSVSAACATALVALYSAYQMIRNGVIDAAVVGGGEEFLNPMHFLEFSALGALAGLSGVERHPCATSRPFDADRDGMVLGEGGGLIVIERESTARKRGARVHGYITSMGASNNHLGMVESSSITQEIAIAASFNELTYGPGDVDLVECHATSTRQGDVEEVRGLKRFFNSGKRTVLTSLKSQIGHTLGASGINSLIRGVMAMKAGLFPSTLNYERPDPEIGLEGSALSVLSRPEEWARGNGRPRRFQVNAFGFGGSNYVVQLEQCIDEQDAVVVSLPTQAHGPVADTSLLPDGLFFFRSAGTSESYRVGVVADTEEVAVSSIQACEPFNGGPIPAKRIKALARQGIHLGPDGVSPAPLAFVFPGQGSHYAGMGHELYQTFSVIREWMDRAAELADFDLLHLLFHDREEDLQKTRWQQPALFTMEYALVQYLVSLGIRPTGLAGHSLGELTALCLAGVYSFEDGFRIVNKRAVCMDKACGMHLDPGVMLACDAPMDLLEDFIRRTEHVYLTNVNSPHQVVLGGGTEAVKSVGDELKSQGYRSTLLRVSMAFHSPIMRCIHDELEEFIEDIEFHSPEIPVISNTTMLPFPDDTAEIKKIVMAHLESPVQWMENVRTLWNDYGVRHFVEVGPREILSNLIMDSVEEADCIQTCLPSAEATIYRTALAQLFARGHLRLPDQPKLISFPGDETSAQRVPSAALASVSPVSSPAGGPAVVERIIEREINAFMLESFGRFIKPNILAAVRRELDPGLSEDGLDRVLGKMFGSVGPVSPALREGTVLEPSPGISLAPQTSPAPQPAAGAATPAASEITETVIRLIMDATGYERDEIAEDMDLREDLAIRSSRLPVIMDSVEGHFGIKIELEDFIDVRTIRDIAERIAMIIDRDRGKDRSQRTGSFTSQAESSAGPEEEKPGIKRVVFEEVPLVTGDVQPVEVSPTDRVVVLSAGSGTGLRREVGDVLRRDYGASIVRMTFMEENGTEGDLWFDFRTEEGLSSILGRLSELEPPAGLVFILDDTLEALLREMDELSELLKGFFILLKWFMESSARKFVLLIQKTSGSTGPARVLAEGALGMFLSTALESNSLHFRTVRVDADTSLRQAIRAGLDRGYRTVETIYRNGAVFTVEGKAVASAFQESPAIALGPDDVVVFSGGGYGITPFLARGLAPFGCKMVLLGRTVLDPQVDFVELMSEAAASEQAIATMIDRRKPDLSDSERVQAISAIRRQLEIVRNVETLRSVGIEASYYNCDVTDSARTNSVLDQIVKRYGKIDGIVHAAGIIRDSFVKQMTVENFSAVLDVKYQGAWNLFLASKDSGLRFFVCLSSAASIQGNPGQCNYAAGNRIMTALMEELSLGDGSIRFKSLSLPPVEGSGMAEDPEIRALMKRMNAGYIHVDEVSALFCRELFIARQEDVRVMFMRSLPELNTVRLDQSDASPISGVIQAETVAFKQEDFPLIDSVSQVDTARGVLAATRAFSHEKDPWIADHKPFSFLRHPLVSAIMALEAFMEASRMLYPHLRVQGVRDARFLDIIDCPPGVERQSEITCCKIDDSATDVVCEVTLATRNSHGDERVPDQLHPNFKGQVVLGPGTLCLNRDMEEFEKSLSQMGPIHFGREDILKQYEQRSEMRGRYRVIESLVGAAPDAIRGKMVYRVGQDFAASAVTRYQYSPYLLEALMQIASFFVTMKGLSENGSFIPFRMGEVLFSRPCVDGEEVIVEGCLKSTSGDGIVWDARGLDQDGNVLMVARNVVFRWFSPSAD